MIIVTGAAGLIGSAVVRELNRRGEQDLILVDHLGSSEKWMNLRSLRFREYLEKDEFLDRVDWELSRREQASDSSSASGDALFAGLQTVIHLGANSSTTEKDASHLIENNYRYSIRMADLCAAFGARYVYASSAATYGDGLLGFDDGHDRLHELRPLNGYGYSKHVFDQYMAGRDFEPTAAGIKYFNVFGPNEYHKGEMQSLVLKAYHQIQETGQLKLFKSYHPDYEDGKQMRDFLYVEDAAAMTVFFALDNRQAKGLFNAGSGVANTWLGLAGAIFAGMNRAVNIDFIDMPDHLKNKYQYYTCAPIDRLSAAGYSRAVTSLENAVLDYVQNYLMPGELRA
ncbi:MAG: ADP-glyceromanno-heptose 6-epimerase [bacterium]|nr:ADP-glyceromanno-heptose 6-epimerase [bacterium]